MKFILHTLLAALMIAGFTWLSKKSTFASALLISLPLTSILALSFVYAETRDLQKVSLLSMNIFWLVLPTLLFFLILPALLRTGWGFWPSLAGSAALMAAIFTGYSWALTRAGISL
jgi:hypothetical protein